MLDFYSKYNISKEDQIAFWPALKSTHYCVSHLIYVLKMYFFVFYTANIYSNSLIVQLFAIKSVLYNDEIFAV